MSLDHQQFLGDNIAAIAAEKAGILKFHVPCVLARQDDLARDVILGVARAVDAPVIEQEVDWQVTNENDTLLFVDANSVKKLPLPALPGAHTTSVTQRSRPSFQASACSRAPLPTTSTFIG